MLKANARKSLLRCCHFSGLPGLFMVPFFTVPFFTVKGLADESLVLWHSQDGLQRDFLERVIAKFSPLTIKAETGMDIISSLLIQRDLRLRLPDMLLVPADYLAIGEGIDFTPLPQDQYRGVHDLAIPNPVRGRGIPLLWGNQLMLYYNKRLVAKPIESWEQLLGSAPPATEGGFIGIDTGSAYVFLSFYLNFLPQRYASYQPLSYEACKKTMNFYDALYTRGALDRNCGYGCISTDFFQGKRPYVVNGDWILKEAQDRLGSDLGVAVLPRLGGKRTVSLRSPLILVFPTLEPGMGNKVERWRHQFVEYLLAEETQNLWFEKAGRFPVNPAAIARARRDPVGKVLHDQLSRSVDMPIFPGVYRMWSGIYKALKLFTVGTLDDREACEKMALWSGLN